MDGTPRDLNAEVEMPEAIEFRGVGSEAKNLKAFCKKPEASAIKFDQPDSKSRHKGFASGEISDPSGTSIELTDGLSLVLGVIPTDEVNADASG